MYTKNHENIYGRRSGRWTVFITLLGALAASLGGCSSPVVIEDPGVNHPANPNAAAAPMSSVPGTLQVEAVEAPEQEADPHAGHKMSH